MYFYCSFYSLKEFPFTFKIYLLFKRTFHSSVCLHLELPALWVTLRVRCRRVVLTLLSLMRLTFLGGACGACAGSALRLAADEVRSRRSSDADRYWCSCLRRTWRACTTHYIIISRTETSTRRTITGFFSSRSYIIFFFLIGVCQGTIFMF